MKKSTLILIAVFFTGIISYINAQTTAISPKEVRKAVYFDKTGPIINLPQLTNEEFAEMEKDAFKKRNEGLEYRQYNYQESALPKGQDPVRQAFFGNRTEEDPVIMNWVAQASPYYPTDVNGTPGPDFYLQTVNCTFAIYDKNDGEKLFGPTAINELFNDVPGGMNNDGDPIALYDDEADRWLVSEFSISSQPYYMLIAISETNDPFGNWYRWSFQMDGFPDYEKYGVWRDGYYMGTNTYQGSDIYVFEREKMLDGDPEAQMVLFENPWRPQSGFHCVPAVDNDGPLAPEGEPGIFLTINDDAWNGGTDELWLFELDVDWENPSNSTFDRVQQIEVAPFSSHIGDGWTNIPQPGTNQKLDGIMQILMNKPQYRNFGDHQTIVACHTVDFNNEEDAGIRWYELNKTDGEWFVRQQGTYAPDENCRWMGSIAMNVDHEIALGFSISSNSVYPGMRITGQSASEYAMATGIMDITETIIHDGEESQTALNRWGDYSSMDIDMDDHHTFWYTSQIVGNGGSRKTRISSFKFSPGGVLTADFESDIQVVADGCQVNFTDISSGTPVSWEWTFEGGEPATSDLQHPGPVTYQTPGVYEVSLTITDLYDSSTKTETAFITVDDEKTPDIDFTVTDTFICSEEVVQFTDKSLNCPETWNWSFSPETYSFVNGTTQNDPFPEVQFNEITSYDLIVQVSNNNGTTTEIYEDLIKVGGSTLPVFQDFEDQENWTRSWDIENPDGNLTWSTKEVLPETSYGEFAGFLNFYRYTGQLGAKDRLISPPLDLTGYTEATLSFDYAFASRYQGFSDSLSIFVSIDCGETWTQIFSAGEDDNGSFATREQMSDEFYPEVQEDWCGYGWGADCITLDLTDFVEEESVKLAFETYNSIGNNLYLDNIIIDGELNAVTETRSIFGWNIFPNPAEDIVYVSHEDQIVIDYITIINAEGKEVISEIQYRSERGLDISSLPEGIYLIKVVSDELEFTEKLLIR